MHSARKGKNEAIKFRITIQRNEEIIVFLNRSPREEVGKYLTYAVSKQVQQYRVLSKTI
jgi:hypothetical protein